MMTMKVTKMRMMKVKHTIKSLVLAYDEVTSSSM